MGLLRIILAFNVVIDHSYPIFGFKMISGHLAVCAFFIISGFYMSLLLDKKYVGKNKSYFLFVSNRFLRIYPVYWVGLFALLVAMFIKLLLFGFDLSVEKQTQYYTHLPLWVAIITVTGDILRETTLLITPDLFDFNQKGPVHLLIQQAWSLQVELVFYLIAPFIFRRWNKKSLLIILALGIAHIIIGVFRIPAINNLMGILFNSFYFVLGSVSYRIYLKIVTLHVPVKTLISLYIVFMLYLTIYTSFHFDPIYGRDEIFIAIITLMIPYLFLLTQKNVFDRWLGELSYPIYIIHTSVIKLLRSSLYFITHLSLLTLAAIGLSMIFGFLIVRYIDIPIDRIRQKRLHK